MQEAPLVACVGILNTIPAFLSISKANWPVLGGQVTSATLAYSEEFCECLTVDNSIYDHGITLHCSVWRHCWCYRGELCLGWKRGLKIQKCIQPGS